MTAVRHIVAAILLTATAAAAGGRNDPDVAAGASNTAMFGENYSVSP